MKRDNIKRAANVYAIDENRNRRYGIEPYSVVDFMEGAKWRISSVWHDVSEEPQGNNELLILNKKVLLSS